MFVESIFCLRKNNSTDAIFLTVQYAAWKILIQSVTLHMSQRENRLLVTNTRKLAYLIDIYEMEESPFQLNIIHPILIQKNESVKQSNIA